MGTPNTPFDESDLETYRFLLRSVWQRRKAVVAFIGAVILIAMLRAVSGRRRLA